MLDSEISLVPDVYLHVSGQAGLIFSLPIIPEMNAEPKAKQSYNFVVIF